jgi:hypothetical protein
VTPPVELDSLPDETKDAAVEHDLWTTTQKALLFCSAVTSGIVAIFHTTKFAPQGLENRPIKSTEKYNE